MTLLFTLTLAQGCFPPAPMASGGTRVADTECFVSHPMLSSKVCDSHKVSVSLLLISSVLLGSLTLKGSSIPVTLVLCGKRSTWQLYSATFGSWIFYFDMYRQPWILLPGNAFTCIHVIRMLGPRTSESVYKSCQSQKP